MSASSTFGDSREVTTRNSQTRRDASVWEFTFEGHDDEHQRVRNALFALAGGGIGTSGGSLLVSASADRWIVAAGVYDGEGPETHLLIGPVLSGTAIDVADARLHRTLDLRAGLLRERIRDGGSLIEMLRFVSLVRPGIVAVRTVFPGPIPRGAARLVAGEDAEFDEGVRGRASWMRVVGSCGGIVAATREQRSEHLVDDFVAVVADGSASPDPAAALLRVDDAAEVGFDALVAEQSSAWAERWEHADVIIEGDDQLQLATRLALFHLMSSAADSGEVALGARGLSGTGYRGHVFWDADTFVLPFFAATHPSSARAMLEYRIRRLPDALDAARELRRAGARFPWESARTGRDVTPVSARDRTGRVVPIRTGQLEEHIVAEVAWAACQYEDWTGDVEFANGPGLRLLIETARYWASRVRVEPDGSAHIYGVIGPDEYHEPVDDNAFTNVMARWTLCRAADALDAAIASDHGVDRGERAAWRGVAAALVDGYDDATGIYEEFAGFRGLEPLIIAEVAPSRPIAADFLLGAERVHGAQVVKQADVLMLHHLVPEEVASGSLEPNLRYYEPRTAHGSSLSPAIHASLFARQHDFPNALDALHTASRVDLDDLTGTTAGGLHVATMGGVWQALVFGFAGVRPRSGRLVVDPHVPPSWNSLEVRVRFHGSQVRVHIEEDQCSVHADAPAPIEVGGTPFAAGPDGISFRKSRSSWEVMS